MLRSRLTYSNVAATIALFIAVAGIPLAWGLARNSVGTKQLKAKSVRTGDLANNAITSPKVKDGSLLERDFATGELPQGAPGPTGAQGNQGAQGATGAQGIAGTARAYGRVSPAGTLTRSKDASVTHSLAGRYCIDVAASIDPASTVIVAVPDLDTSGTTVLNQPSDDQAIVETSTAPGGFGCGAGSDYAIRTAVADFDINGALAGNAMSDRGFVFIVP